MLGNINPAGVALSVFLCSLVLADLVRRLSIRQGFVYRPAAHRWSQRTVAMGGGIAIFISFSAVFLILPTRLITALLPSLLIVFLLGWTDDMKAVMPAGKLLVQTVAASWVVSHGIQLPIGHPVIGPLLTVGWIVILTNAMNIIDNMDGLAAGVAAITALCLSLHFAMSGDQHALFLLSLGIAMSSLGFLMHNFFPARIFMGDSGSLTLGFSLSVLSTQVRVTGGSLAPISSFIAICLLLIIPIFDVALVSIARRNSGRPIMAGGRDHSSHRLVWLGFSDKCAVLIIYALGAAGGILSAFLAVFPFILHLVIFLFLMAVLSLFVEFLLQIPVYAEAIDKSFPVKGFWRRSGGINTLPVGISFVIAVARDLMLLSSLWGLLYYFFPNNFSYGALYLTIPLSMMFTIGCFILFGRYRMRAQERERRDFAWRATS